MGFVAGKEGSLGAESGSNENEGFWRGSRNLKQGGLKVMNRPAPFRFA